MNATVISTAHLCLRHLAIYYCGGFFYLALFLTTHFFLCFCSEVARLTILHPKTFQRVNGSPEDSPTCVQGADADNGKSHMIILPFNIPL